MLLNRTAFLSMRLLNHHTACYYYKGKYIKNKNSKHNKENNEPFKSVTPLTFKPTYEDNNAYHILMKLPQYDIIPAIKPHKIDIVPGLLGKIGSLNKQWMNQSTKEILEKFVKLSNLSSMYTLTLSDPAFQIMTQSLQESFPKMNVDQLFVVLQNLVHWKRYQYPESLLLKLDTEMLKHIDNIDLKNLLKSLNYWYLLSYGKKSIYFMKALNLVGGKLSLLDSKDIVMFMFYCTISRSQDLLKRIPNFNAIISRIINKLSTEEIVIVCLGYFKTKTKANPDICLKVIEKTHSALSRLSDVSIGGVMKFLRLSECYSVGPKFQELLIDMNKYLPKYSIVCQVQICLTAANLKVYNPDFLNTISENLTKSLDSGQNDSIKYPERFLFALTTFNHTLEDNSFYDSLCNYLNFLLKSKHMVKYNYCIFSCVVYLLRLGYYPSNLVPAAIHMSEENNMKWHNKGYNKDAEILELDVMLEVLYSEKENGTRIHPDFRLNLAKKLCLSEIQFPIEKTKLSRRNQSLQEIWQCLNQLLDKEQKYIKPVVILPHSVNPDLLFCLDKATNKIHPIPDKFFNVSVSDVKHPMNLNRFRWVTVIILPSTSKFVSSQFVPSLTVSRINQLKTIGYEVLSIPNLIIFGKSHRERILLVKEMLKRSNLNIEV